MAANQTLVSSITELIMEYYDKLLLEKLRANTVMYQFAEKKPLPRVIWASNNPHTNMFADGERLVSDGLTTQEELNKVCGIV